jgi:GNAT superfamily N-acetyltransferase
MTEDQLLILIAKTENHEIIGYCVSTIDEMKHGEIDSLFVIPDYRGYGIGKKLTERSIEWLKLKNCNPIRLAINYGHESVLPFYQNLGFYPRLTILEYQ